MAVEVRGLTCQFNFGNEQNRLLNDVKGNFEFESLLKCKNIDS